MAKKNRVARSPQHLADESKTVWYEFSQLCESADLLRKGTFGGTGVSHNNTVPGFVSAFRNLACFFYPHLPNDFPELQKDDLGADEYLADWPTRCPMPSQILRDAKKAADKQVMHMTAARRNLNFIPGNEHYWPVDDIERELLGALRAFLGAVTPALVDSTALASLQHLASRTPVATSGMITHTGCISVTGASGTGSARTDVRTIAPVSGFYAKTQP
jgi:hypothetical protein